jgi:hypothetical protein
MTARGFAHNSQRLALGLRFLAVLPMKGVQMPRPPRWTWLRRADACRQGSSASPISKVQTRWIMAEARGSLIDRLGDRAASPPSPARFLRPDDS